jgi:hypothetical protein
MATFIFVNVFSYKKTYFFNFDYILCSVSKLESVEKNQIWVDSAKYKPTSKWFNNAL